MKLLYERLDSVKYDLENWLKENPDEKPDREVHELADLAVPCYTSDVLALAPDIPADCWDDDERSQCEQMVARAALTYFTQCLQRVVAQQLIADAARFTEGMDADQMDDLERELGLA